MSEVIKWWKNKTAVRIILILVSAVIVSAFCGVYIPWPWNLITVLIISIGAGVTSRVLFNKELEKISKNNK